MSASITEVAKQWFQQVWNEGRREAIAEMLAPDAVIQDGSEASTGPEGFYPFFDRMQATFSDIHVSFHDAITQDDEVSLRWSCTMRHTGNGLDVPATGKTVHVTGISVVRIANGMLVAGWQNWDMLGLMQQIRGEALAPTYIAAKATGSA